MTEKRYVYTQDTLTKADVFDNENGEFICCTLSVWADKLVNKLNEQDEQIKLLEKDQLILISEIVKIKQTIRHSIESERTQIGKNVLNQLLEAIQ